MLSHVRITFHNCEDPVTLERKVEAKAINPRTEEPVVSLPRAEMAQWLANNGYHAVVGSLGSWVR